MRYFIYSVMHKGVNGIGFCSGYFSVKDGRVTQKVLEKIREHVKNEYFATDVVILNIFEIDGEDET